MTTDSDEAETEAETEPEADKPKKRTKGSYNKQQKAEVVAYAKEHNISDASMKFQIPRNTVYIWVNRGSKSAPRKARTAPIEVAAVETAEPEQKTAASFLRTIGLDPKEWSIVHSSGLRLR